ncbi:hypothetical protein CR513_28193, partial [Mucuna pruriens]
MSFNLLGDYDLAPSPHIPTIFSLIIDRGSSANVSNLRLVEKLVIPTLPHLKPYKLQWLSERQNGIRSFVMWFPWKPHTYYWVGLDNLIGGEVCEDHIKMKKKIEEERKELEKVEKAKRKESEKNKVKSKSLSENKESTNKKSTKKIEKQEFKKKEKSLEKRKVKRVILARKKPLFILPTNMCSLVSSLISSLPTSFSEMLESFNELFPKDIPHEFPQIRGIEHHIDFTLEATLLDSAA